MPDIRKWLENLGLGAYANAFIDNDVDLEALPHLTETMLKEMGLSIGVRARVMAGIATLKSKSADSEGTTGPQAGPVNETRDSGRDAERRHMTVMFCDLVGSTALSAALDPEDLRSLISSYQAAAGQVIERYEGYVAQYLGDGIMAYFGWPAAHEDDAERAVRAALDLIGQVKSVEATVPIQVRIGVASGLVVVGRSAGEHNLAVGETPNLAARLQSLAGVDEIIIDPTTRHLVGSKFDLTDMGPHELKGFSNAVTPSRIEGLVRSEFRFESHGQRLSPFVGRDPEIRMLLDRWQNAKDGEGQVVLLEGEPGLGKSRLVREFCERIESEPHLALHYQCSPYHTSSALRPVVEQLERAAGFELTDNSQARLDKLESMLTGPNQDRAIFAALMSIETSCYPAPELTPQRQKEKTLQALAARLESLSRDNPILLLVEDAHWIDPTTQEALDIQLSALAELPILAIITYRPEYRVPWSNLSHATPLRLARLGRRQAMAMVNIVGSGLPEELRAQIVAKTDGIPLYVEEMANAVGNGGAVGEAESQLGANAEAGQLGIPWSLQNALSARLDRLGSAKALAQIAACIGRHFSRSQLAALPLASGPDLDENMSRLIASGLVYPEGLGDDERFAFKHFLMQQAAYASLLISTRRQIHADIAAALISSQNQAHSSDLIVIAQHLRAAQQTREAIPWLRRAAQRAARAGSAQESMQIIAGALDMIDDFQGTKAERDQAELQLLMAKLPICIAINGFASDDANDACTRALSLAISLGDKALESTVLYQIATLHEVRGEYSQTQEVLARRYQILPDPPDPEPEVESGELMACSTFYQGRFDTSIEHANHALQYVEPEKHTALGENLAEDPTIACLFWLAKALLIQGKVEQARARQQEALDCARRSPNWYAQSQADIEAATFLAYQREYEAARGHAERGMDSSARVGLVYRQAVATLIFEWASGQTDAHAPDLERLRTSLNVFRQVGAMIGYGFYLSLAAETYARFGEHDQGAQFMREAMQDSAGSRGFFYESELHRLSGDLLLARSCSEVLVDAENAYQQGLYIAREQGARLFELRSASSLARLWLEQGQAARARELLEPAYEWFSEGFDAVDLTKAKALLVELD